MAASNGLSKPTINQRTEYFEGSVVTHELTPIQCLTYDLLIQYGINKGNIEALNTSIFGVQNQIETTEARQTEIISQIKALKNLVSADEITENQKKLFNEIMAT